MDFTDAVFSFSLGVLLGAVAPMFDKFAANVARKNAAKALGQYPDLQAVNKSIRQMYQSEHTEMRSIAVIVDGESFHTQRQIIRILNLLSTIKT